jgi:DNA polymerase III subunit delta
MPLHFIYGSDDYLVEQSARARWAELSAGLDPEFGLEVIDGRCQRVEEAADTLNRVRSSLQTVGLFGGGRAVWLKGFNLIAESVVSRSETTLTALEELKPTLTSLPSDVSLLISATPIDKRLSFFKWLSSNAQGEEIAAIENLDAPSLNRLAAARGISLQADAAELFIKKVGSSARSVESELEKLSLYKGASPSSPQQVALEDVIEMTAEVAEGEFFEPIEAFYSRQPSWVLDSLRRYFMPGKQASARPLIAALFNRNRLLLMIKAAQAEGLCKVSPRGLSWTAKAESLKAQFGSEKTPFNLFAQNPWYLGRLAAEAERFTLPQLQGIQHGLVGLFEDIHEQEESTAFEAFILKHLK